MVKLNSSYIARLITLSIVYFERIWRLPLRYFRIKGSRIILRDSNNNFLVKLNKNTILGRKDELLHISNDKVLLFNILNYGVYEKPTIDFFREFTNSKKGIWTFVDIGANCGLITLGSADAMNQLQKSSLSSRYFRIEFLWSRTLLT